MACGCKKKTTPQFKWTSPPDSEGVSTTMTYKTEIEAKAKVIRQGGSYAPL